MKLQEILSKYTAHTFGNSPKMYNEQQVLAIVKEVAIAFENWTQNNQTGKTEELYDKFLTQ